MSGLLDDRGRGGGVGAGGGEEKRSRIRTVNYVLPRCRGFRESRDGCEGRWKYPGKIRWSFSSASNYRSVRVAPPYSHTIPHQSRF